MSTRIVFFREIVFVDIDFNFLGVKTRGNALKGFFFLCYGELCSMLIYLF